MSFVVIRCAHTFFNYSVKNVEILFSFETNFVKITNSQKPKSHHKHAPNVNKKRQQRQQQMRAFVCVCTKL